MVEVWELLTSQNHLAILLIIILHTAIVYGNTSAGNRLGQAFFRGRRSALLCQCKYWVTLCVRLLDCVCVWRTMTGIFVSISCFSWEELLTFDDGLTELPGSLHQPNPAIGGHSHIRALACVALTHAAHNAGFACNSKQSSPAKHRSIWSHQSQQNT